MDSEHLNTIGELAKPIVEQEDLFVVDVEEKGGNETVLWVYVDSEREGVQVEACSRISRELGFLLEAHDLIGSRYRLNVSSPGLSRPLTDRRQYGKNCGRTVRVRFKNGDQYERKEGTLIQVQEDGIEVEVEGARKEIPFDAILETKVIPQL